MTKNYSYFKSLNFIRTTDRHQMTYCTRQSKWEEQEKKWTDPFGESIKKAPDNCVDHWVDHRVHHWVDHREDYWANNQGDNWPDKMLSLFKKLRLFLKMQKKMGGY